MRRSLILVGAFAVTAAACFPSLEGLSSGGTSGDASIDFDASATDASIDQVVPPDGAPVGADGPTNTFCIPGAHAFCDDFEGGPLLSNWDAVTIDLGGKVELSTTRAFAGKRSLFTTLPRRGNVDTYYAATVRRSRSGKWSRAIINMEVWVEPVVWQAGDVNSGVLAVAFESNGPSKGIALSLDRTGTTLGVDDETLPQGPVFPEGRWVHVMLDIDPSSSVELKVDGTTHAKKNLAAPWMAGGSPSLRLELGVNGYNDPAPEYAFYYDNVTVDLP